MDNRTEMVLEEERELDLLELIHFLLEKYKIILAAVFAGLLVALVYVGLLATPIYEATAQLYVVNSQDSAIDLSDLQIGSYLTEDYQLVFDTWEVNQMVIENLDLPYTVAELRSMMTVKNPSNTRALLITVASPDAQEAADIANEYAEVAKWYISETMLTDKPSTLSSALAPLKPVRPQKLTIVVLAMLVCAALAVVTLTIMFILDDKIKTGEDLLKYAGMAPLAVIPMSAAARRRRNGTVVTRN